VPRVVGLLAALLLAAAVPCTAAEPLRLSTGVRSPWTEDDRRGFLDLVIAEMFRRLGFPAEVEVYSSSERAMLNADSGIDDGVAMRIKGIEKDYPNLIRVEEKVADNDFVGYSTHLRVATPTFEALRPYLVAHVVGWKVFEYNLDSSFKRTTAQDAEQLFGLLKNDRVDIVLHERWQGHAYLRAAGLKAQALEPPLARSEMFIYLHRKHAHLVEPAAQSLRSMKADGTYDRLTARTLRVSP
jgi:polar amino acid transport system substrate-binding protein